LDRAHSGRAGVLDILGIVVREETCGRFYLELTGGKLEYLRAVALAVGGVPAGDDSPVIEKRPDSRLVKQRPNVVRRPVIWNVGDNAHGSVKNDRQGLEQISHRRKDLKRLRGEIHMSQCFPDVKKDGLNGL